MSLSDLSVVFPEPSVALAGSVQIYFLLIIQMLIFFYCIQSFITCSQLFLFTANYIDVDLFCNCDSMYRVVH